MANLTSWCVLRSVIVPILLLILSPFQSLASGSIRIASAEDGTLYHTFATELAAYLQSEFPVGYNFEALPTSGSLDNIERLLVDPSVSLALAQEDVAHYYYTGADNDFFLISRENDYQITCLGRLFSEQFYFVVRPGIKSYTDIDTMHVGPLKSGTYATYTSFRQTQRPLWREVHEGEALDRFLAGEVDGFFEVNTTPNWTVLDLLERGGKCDIMPVRRTDFSLGLGLYRATSIPDSLYGLSSDRETISVPAVLLATRNLPNPIAESILRAIRDPWILARYFPESRHVLESSALIGTAMENLPLPPHPSLARETLGRRPYLVSVLAVLLMGAIWMAWALLPKWSPAFRRRHRLHASTRDNYRDGHLLLGTIMWIVVVAAGVKLFETQALMGGRAGAGTAFVFMGFFRTLGWLLIFIVSGYPGELYPASAIARYLPITAQIVTYAFATYVGVRILTYIFNKVITGKKGRQLANLGKHVVICNWNPRGLRLVEMLRADDVPKEQRNRKIAIVTREELTEAEKQVHECVTVPVDPWEKSGIEKARVEFASSIIILSPNGCSDPDECDGVVIRTALAIRNWLKHCQQSGMKIESPSIVAELNRHRNREFLENLGIDEIVISRDIGMRLLAQTVICPGVTTFFNEILDAAPDSNEVYEIGFPDDLAKKDADFSLVLKYYRDHSGEEFPVLPIGLKINKNPSSDENDDDDGTPNGRAIVLVNPQKDELREHRKVFSKDDQILVLADVEPKK